MPVALNWNFSEHIAELKVKLLTSKPRLCLPAVVELRLGNAHVPLPFPCLELYAVAGPVFRDLLDLFVAEHNCKAHAQPNTCCLSLPEAAFSTETLAVLFDVVTTGRTAKPLSFETVADLSRGARWLGFEHLDVAARNLGPAFALSPSACASVYLHVSCNDGWETAWKLSCQYMVRNWARLDASQRRLLEGSQLGDVCTLVAAARTGLACSYVCTDTLARCCAWLASQPAELEHELLSQFPFDKCLFRDALDAARVLQALPLSRACHYPGALFLRQRAEHVFALKYTSMKWRTQIRLAALLSAEDVQDVVAAVSPNRRDDALEIIGDWCTCRSDQCVAEHGCQPLQACFDRMKFDSWWTGQLDGARGDTPATWSGRLRTMQGWLSRLHACDRELVQGAIASAATFQLVRRRLHDDWSTFGYDKAQGAKQRTVMELTAEQLLREVNFSDSQGKLLRDALKSKAATRAARATCRSAKRQKCS